jgi:hypothetical protein
MGTDAGQYFNIDQGSRMKEDVKIYNIKAFIRKNLSGELDMEKSLQLAKEITNIAYLHGSHNILIDARDTTVGNVKITDMMRLTLEIANNLPNFKSKIANVIPGDEQRLKIARQFQSCMVLKGFSYEVFTDFEKALDWLSDTRILK